MDIFLLDIYRVGWMFYNIPNFLCCVFKRSRSKQKRRNRGSVVIWNDYIHKFTVCSNKQTSVKNYEIWLVCCPYFFLLNLCLLLLVHIYYRQLVFIILIKFHFHDSLWDAHILPDYISLHFNLLHYWFYDWKCYIDIYEGCPGSTKVLDN